MGLRSLSPSDPAYTGHYGGSPHDRDAAYHRGTAWPFLAGAFARAYANAYGDRTRALRFIEALASRLDCYGMGTLAEIADGDAPQRGSRLHRASLERRRSLTHVARFTGE